MKAIISACGRQYSVRQGDVIAMDRLPMEEGAEFAIPGATERALRDGGVLLLEADGDAQVGQPTLDNVRVRFRVIGEEKGKKIRIFKYRRRKTYRKTMGHRQRHTRVQVEGIEVAGGAQPAGAAAAD